MPWKSADTSKRLWTIKLRGIADSILICHPMKRANSSQRMIIAYTKTDGGYQATAAMLVRIQKAGAHDAVYVEGLTTLPKFRGQGFAYNMYVTMVFDKGLAVISDDVQTDGGAAMWNKLAQQFPDHVGVFEDEVEDAVALDQWKDGNPLTNPFTQLVISPTPYKQSQVA